MTAAVWVEETARTNLEAEQEAKRAKKIKS